MPSRAASAGGWCRIFLPSGKPRGAERRKAHVQPCTVPVKARRRIVRCARLPALHWCGSDLRALSAPARRQLQARFPGTRRDAKVLKRSLQPGSEDLALCA